MRHFQTGISVVVCASVGYFAGSTAQGVSNKTVPLPAGAIIAFPADGPCPAGWTDYQPAAARIMLGAVEKEFYDAEAAQNSFHITEPEAAYDTKGVIDPNSLVREYSYPNFMQIPYVIVRHCVKQDTQGR